MAGLESLLIGRVLGGRYRVEEVIGRGGMGAVYRAFDERLGRQVALKVITAGGSGNAEARDRLRARFFREARSAAALPHHPNVVPVYDYGSDEELGLDYIVMELLRGADLATRLATSQAPALAASLKILVEAAQGIAVGHRQGLIHRDVKPGNIFLAEGHKNEIQVRVVDFGIAKLADEEDTLGQLTQDGGVPHSPAFASPEQLRGLSHLTPASDVFSLGAVGYQLLVGERPFTDSDRNQMSLGMAVPPPSLRERNPAIPGAVDAIVRKALAPEPEQRYQDAGEMAAALATAIRSLGDLPLDPYLAGSTILSGTARARVPDVPPPDDRTSIAAPVEDDRTLVSPQAPPQSVAVPAPPSRDMTPVPAAAPLPLRRPARPPQKRGMGGTLVWLLVAGGLTAVGFWAWGEINRSPGAFPEMANPALDSMGIAFDTSSVNSDSLGLLQANLANQEGTRLFNEQRWPEAYVSFQRALQLRPEVPEFHRNLGLAMVQMGMYSNAVREITISLQGDPNPGRPDAFSSLGWAQLQIGDTTSAITNLNEYLRREQRAARRRPVEQILAQVRAAQDPGVQLLGEEVVRPEPADVGPSAPLPSGPGPTGLNSPNPSGGTPPSGNSADASARRG